VLALVDVFDLCVRLCVRGRECRFVVLALVDTAFVDMAVNLYESSLRPLGIDNFLFVGVGRRACQLLGNASLPCHHYADDRATAVASTYRSPDFIRKMNIRTEMILDALSVGFSVLHTDLDVVFLRNPIPHLKVRSLHRHSVDCLFQQGSHRPQTPPPVLPPRKLL